MSGCQALPSAVQFAPEVAMSLKGMPTTSLAPSLRYNSLAVGQGRRGKEGWVAISKQQQQQRMSAGSNAAK